MKKVISVLLTVIIAIGTCFVLTGCGEEKAYKEAVDLMEVGKYEDALLAFKKIENYQDSSDKIKECENAITYEKAVDSFDKEKYKEAREAFGGIKEYKDSSDKFNESSYKYAVSLKSESKFDEAKAVFLEIKDYEDSENEANDCDYEKANSLAKEEKYDEAKAIFDTLEDYISTNKKDIFYVKKSNISVLYDYVINNGTKYDELDEKYKFMTNLDENGMYYFSEFKNNKGEPISIGLFADTEYEYKWMDLIFYSASDFNPKHDSSEFGARISVPLYDDAALGASTLYYLKVVESGNITGASVQGGWFGTNYDGTDYWLKDINKNTKWVMGSYRDYLDQKSYYPKDTPGMKVVKEVFDKNIPYIWEHADEVMEPSGVTLKKLGFGF